MPTLLKRGVALTTWLRSAFFFPFTLSVVTVGLTWLWLLDPVVGPFNYYLRALGVPVRSWLANPATAMAVIIVTTVWWVAGYYLVIYLAGLQDIPRELYDAAAVDGARPWHQVWRITVPLLGRTTTLVAVLQFAATVAIWVAIVGSPFLLALAAIVYLWRRRRRGPAPAST